MIHTPFSRSAAAFAMRLFGERRPPAPAPSPPAASPAMALLGDELAGVRRYLADIQSLFEERLIIDVFCTGDAALVPVPAGLLRRLVERAVALGVARSGDRMVLSLFARMHGRVLRIGLRSEMASMDLAHESDAALTSAIQTLRDAYGARAGLGVEQVGPYSAVSIMIDDGLRLRG